MKSSSPLIYSCSGCSNVAQLANDLALDLDQNELAEMSCIVGVGGGVAPLVRLARSGRPVIVLDGCSLQCSKMCLDKVGVKPAPAMTFNKLGLRKRKGEKYLAEEYDVAKNELMQAYREFISNTNDSK
ncbi:putative zinc-binding protein [Paludibacterium denitrificans]|uniref:Zinc-binding protein n=1 Tax=Paludibacterium denitrificans TaxID=2675226 RepID=A0A844GCH1_9NEIS|nr:putative zinc-binding protein [Paludibacterium denitrificans]MTD32305.1 zinc-binding protein [Paludibacterium denitrificans]